MGTANLRTQLNHSTIARNVQESLMLVTALSPLIGHQKAAHIAESALDHVDEKTFDALVDPIAMVGQGVGGA